MDSSIYPRLTASIWKRAREYAGTDFSGFAVVISMTRDDRELARANWKAACAELRDLTGVRVEGFRHWGCGWFQSLMVEPSAPRKTLDAVEAVLEQLADYPSLDDEMLSELEGETIRNAWGDMSVRERADHCRAVGVSIFAARHDRVPSDCWMRLRDLYCG